jgi:hypothetical protein
MLMLFALSEEAEIAEETDLHGATEKRRTEEKNQARATAGGRTCPPFVFSVAP